MKNKHENINKGAKKAPRRRVRGSNIPWHPAFIQALQLELEDYKDVLEFHSEFQLTTEPLRIDCVVVRKTKDVVIEKNIAAIFREFNLLEYKSPGDYVSISDFYKVYAYACLYTSINGIPITDLTMTFVESRYPRKLIKHLRNVRGFTVAKTSKGIYTVSGDILPIQIIDNRHLSAEDNLWLRNLSNELERQEYEHLLSVVAGKGKIDGMIAAYLHAVTHANVKAIEEMIEMTDYYRLPKSIEKALEKAGWAAAWEAKYKDKWEAKYKHKLEAKYREQERKLINAQWQTVVTNKDAEIARLRAELEAAKNG